VEEAAAVLARAAAEGRRVSIGTPDRPPGDITLSTRRLARVLEHEAGDLTATVEAGIRISELNALLAAKGQMLALDPPGDPTVGAALAANRSGPRRHRYGAPRDLVLGVTLVLADGTVASAGGKVVKNVAGYDLGKLVCGSEGLLALIARVSLRLHPLPAAARTLAAPAEDAAGAHRRVQALLRSQLVPSALDLLWDGAAGTLLVLFEGSERAVAAQLEAARSLVGGEEADPSVWSEALALQARARGRISFPPRGLPAALAAMGEALVRPGIGSAYPLADLRDEGDAGARALAERIRAAFDPRGALA
jgi:glycolate oxidase FAD binding subunit